MVDGEKEKLLVALEKINEEIAEQERRIPPHSVQPAQIAALEALEEKRDEILEKLDKLG